MTVYKYSKENRILCLTNILFCQNPNTKSVLCYPHKTGSWVHGKCIPCRQQQNEQQFARSTTHVAINLHVKFLFFFCWTMPH